MALKESDCEKSNITTNEENETEEEILEIEVHKDFKLFLLWDN